MGEDASTRRLICGRKDFVGPVAPLRRKPHGCTAADRLLLKWPALAASQRTASEGPPRGSHHRGEIMEINRFIAGKVDWVLAHKVFGRLCGKRPSGRTRLCPFGHAVFSGNNLCNYGQQAA